MLHLTTHPRHHPASAPAIQATDLRCCQSPLPEAWQILPARMDRAAVVRLPRRSRAIPARATQTVFAFPREAKRRFARGIITSEPRPEFQPQINADYSDNISSVSV